MGSGQDPSDLPKIYLLRVGASLKIRFQADPLLRSKVTALSWGDRQTHVLNPLHPLGKIFYAGGGGGWETSNPAKFLPFHFMKDEIYFQG